MGKFKDSMKKNIKDETAAFIILVCMVITFSLTIGTFEYIRYTRLAAVNSNVNSQSLNKDDSISKEEFATIEDVTSQEDLAKLQNKQEENKKDENENEDSKNSNKTENKAEQSYTKQYYIKVNYGAQVVNIYAKDENGEYTVPVKAMVCSTGTHTPTSGKFTIGYRWEWLRMIGDVFGHYVTQIDGDILFHSVPYITKGDLSSLEYWEYDKLGTKASLGCVRLTSKDALWIYNNVGAGTIVEFYSSSNPGPLGKPSAQKISSAPTNIRGWDPTDPNKNNPWPNYLKQLQEEEDKKEENGNSSGNTNTTGENNTNVNETVGGNNSATDTNTAVDKNDNTANTNTTVDGNDNTTNTNTTIGGSVNVTSTDTVVDGNVNTTNTAATTDGSSNASNTDTSVVESGNISKNT